jgi:hypothetical protein
MCFTCTDAAFLAERHPLRIVMAARHSTAEISARVMPSRSTLKLDESISRRSAKGTRAFIARGQYGRSGAALGRLRSWQLVRCLGSTSVTAIDNGLM